MKAGEESNFEKIPNRKARARPARQREWRQRQLQPSNRNGRCPSGKVHFPTHAAALRRGGKILSGEGTAPEAGAGSKVEQLWAYKCPHCGSYHLTKQAQV
jgi:uncharacterized OB-fold protein